VSEEQTPAVPESSEPANMTPPTVPAEPQPVVPPSAPEAIASPRPARPAGLFWGTGRRKSSVARVRLMPGDGQFVVNKRPVEQYFTEPQDRLDVVAPLELAGVRRNWSVFVNVDGGGHTGQAGAIRLGLARALVKANPPFEPTLRDAGYLTRDARRVERKKYGQRKARRRFQFSKR